MQKTTQIEEESVCYEATDLEDFIEDKLHSWWHVELSQLTPRSIEGIGHFLDRRAQEDHAGYGGGQIKSWYVRIPQESSVDAVVFGGKTTITLLKDTVPQEEFAYIAHGDSKLIIVHKPYLLAQGLNQFIFHMNNTSKDVDLKIFNSSLSGLLSDEGNMFYSEPSAVSKSGRTTSYGNLSLVAYYTQKFFKKFIHYS